MKGGGGGVAGAAPGLGMVRKGLRGVRQLPPGCSGAGRGHHSNSSSLDPAPPLVLAQALDPSITALQALQQLSLSMNPLEALPPHCTALRALRILEVGVGDCKPPGAGLEGGLQFSTMRQPCPCLPC